MNSMFRLCLSAFILVCLSVTGASANEDDITIAFIGDQDVGDDAREVLQLVADSNTDLLLIQGDLGYGARASTQWIKNIDEILGPDFPVLIVVGNHENFEWPVYQQWQEQRIRDVPELRCEGNVGVKAHCTFRGVSVVQVAQGVFEVDGVERQDNYAEYLESELSNSPNAWRICSWHKNQQRMQVGGKLDETGWDIYTACLKHGGIIATAHEHSYSRTYLMSDFENQKVIHQKSLMQIGPYSTFAFVSGLGGVSIRSQRVTGDWWASAYTRSQDADYGALFCTIRDKRAACQFTDVNGRVPDRFLLDNQNVLKVSNEPTELNESDEQNELNNNTAEIEIDGEPEVSKKTSSGRLGLLLLNVLFFTIVLRSTARAE